MGGWRGDAGWCVALALVVAVLRRRRLRHARRPTEPAHRESTSWSSRPRRRTRPTSCARIDNPWLPLDAAAPPGATGSPASTRGRRRDRHRRATRPDEVAGRGDHAGEPHRAGRRRRPSTTTPRTGRATCGGSAGEGVWQAGEDGAEAGLAMPATPRLGDGWRAAYGDGRGRRAGSTVATVTSRPTVPAGRYADLRRPRRHRPARAGTGAAGVLRARGRAGRGGLDRGPGYLAELESAARLTSPAAGAGWSRRPAPPAAAWAAGSLGRAAARRVGAGSRRARAGAGSARGSPGPAVPGCHCSSGFHSCAAWSHCQPSWMIGSCSQAACSGGPAGSTPAGTGRARRSRAPRPAPAGAKLSPEPGTGSVPWPKISG